MPRAAANGIEIEYDTFGEATNPALLLVMGFTAQLIAWDERFCQALADHGFYVIRFDNRDCGLTTHLDGTGYGLIDGHLSFRDSKEAGYGSYMTNVVPTSTVGFKVGDELRYAVPGPSAVSAWRLMPYGGKQAWYPVSRAQGALEPVTYWVGALPTTTMNYKPGDVARLSVPIPGQCESARLTKTQGWKCVSMTAL